jgi:hypothetical protein
MRCRKLRSSTIRWIPFSTQFCDKADILRKQGELDKWGVQKADWKADFRGIQSLRDQLAHGNDFAVSAEAARKVCALVRTMDDWLVRLDGMLSGVRPPMIDNDARKHHEKN